MPLYKYQAKETPQKLVEGQIDAPTKELAIKRIEDMGYFPIKLEEASSIKVPTFFKKVHRKAKNQEIILFSRQLGTLIKAGIPILKALGIISEQTQSPHFSSIIKDVFNDLKEGAKFSVALSRYPKTFSKFYVAMVQTGEDSGNLERILFRLADYRKAQSEMASKIKLASIYPLIMGIVGLGTVIFMLTFVMPRLMRIFDDLGENLPLPTKILISLSESITQWGGFILIGLVVSGFIIRKQLRKDKGKRALSVLQLHVPVFRDLVLKRELGLLSRTLELLVRSGIPILKSIELTAPVIGNLIIRESFLESYQELKQGAFLGETLKKFKVFPAFMTNLITVGEESGKLDVSLAELADTYEKDTDEKIKTFTAILEPVMILGMGLIVGFMVIAMLLPIFEVNLMIG